MIDNQDLRRLHRCVALAAEALEAGDEPFGSILIDADGSLLAEARNRVVTSHPIAHPELELAHWAGLNMAPGRRASATVYTSGEHCPMCAAAHGWVGLGRIVLASSSHQLAEWLTALGAPPGAVRMRRIVEVVPSAIVEGPVEELAEQVRELHYRAHGHGTALA